MALILGDGFDHYPTAKILSKWDDTSACTIDALYGRLGSQGCKTNAGASLLGFGALSKNLPAANAAHGIFGQAIYIPALPQVGYTLINGVSDVTLSADCHICSFFGADGSFAIGYFTRNTFSNTTTILASSAPGMIAAASWRYVETKVKVHSSTGFMEIKIDGITAVSYTGNTRRSSPTNDYFTRVVLGGSTVYNGQTEFWYDDFYYCDDTGSINNTYLGDVQLQAIYPDGVGSSTAWTPVGVAANWDAVNETAPDDNTTYNKSLTVNALDMFTMQDISATAADVKGLLCNARIYKDDATTRTYALQVQTGASAIVELATRTAPGGYTNQQDVSEVSPATSTFWTVAEVNAMQHGIKVKS